MGVKEVREVKEVIEVIEVIEVLAKASGKAERKPYALLIIGGRASRSTTLRNSVHYEFLILNYELDNIGGRVSRPTTPPSNF